jgi:hypothetical protein
MDGLVRAGDKMKLRAKAYLKIANEAWRKKYDDAGGFREGLAEVKLDGKRGFIDKKGNEYWDMTKDQAREQMKKR